jgi:polyketide cyclase/dehydrase/lipid transport protein
VRAAPRTVWATLHDVANARLLVPELDPGVTATTWPAAAAVRHGRARLGLLREPALAESLEARPVSRFRYRIAGDGFVSEWGWTLEPIAGGTRVVHDGSFASTDRVTSLLVRVGTSLEGRVETHLRLLKERAEAAEAVRAEAAEAARTEVVPGAGPGGDIDSIA